MNADGAAPAWEIHLNGRPLPRQARSDLESVTVLEDLHALSMFTVTLHNPDPGQSPDSRQSTVRWSDSELFEIGTEVKILLGYGESLYPAMTGEVTGLEPDFAAGRLPTLTVRGYDHRHRLTRAQRTRTFSNTTDSAVAEELATRAGLDFAKTEDGTTTEPELAYVVQNNQTDLAFLQNRARLIGYEVYVRDKVLHFGPPRHGVSGSRTLRLGDDVSGFTPVLGSLSQVSSPIPSGDASQA